MQSFALACEYRTGTGECQLRMARDGSVTLHVALDGDDRWSGALPSPAADGRDGPLASLHAARDAVRELRRKGQDGDVRVLIRDGVHLLRETVVFGLEDAAPRGGRNIYEAYPDETPILSAGIPLGGWTRLQEA